MNIKIKTTLIILITFIIGMVAGSMITQAFLKYRMKKVLSMNIPAGFAAHFERIIEPTDEQRKAVREVLYKYGEKLSEMRQKIGQEFLPINKAMQEELNSILTPEQKKRLEKRFFRRGPGGFFRRPGDKPLPPPWRKKQPKQEEKTGDSGQEAEDRRRRTDDSDSVNQ